MLLLPFGELFSYLFDDRVSNVDRDAESLYGAAKKLPIRRQAALVNIRRSKILSPIFDCYPKPHKPPKQRYSHRRCEASELQH